MLTMSWYRQFLGWPQPELSFSEGANEARTILWLLVPSMRINYPIQRGRIFFIHQFLQLSNNLDCLLHLIFHFRRRKCPHKGTPIVHLTNFAFDLSVASQGEKPDVSSSMPFNCLNPCQQHHSHKEKAVIWYRMRAWVVSSVILMSFLAWLGGSRSLIHFSCCRILYYWTRNENHFSSSVKEKEKHLPSHYI